MKKFGFSIVLIMGAVFVYTMLSIPTSPSAPTPPPPPPELYCGDGIVTPPEQCDGGPRCDDNCQFIPPPPPPISDCTPGYWKNHTEDWAGHGCGGRIPDRVLHDMLSPEYGHYGGRDRVWRERAAYLLNTCETVFPNCD